MSQSLHIEVVKPQPSPTGGLALFAIVRNEDYFLPFFFEHYRSLGIENFLIYDDHSTAPTLDFLHAQPDCGVITSQRRFSDDFGLDALGAPLRLPQLLKETLPEIAFPGRWTLTVDADEFLVLPSGVGDLPAFTRLLDAAGQPYATAPMVDFYGETLDHRNYDRRLGPFAGNPYFDAGPYYEWGGEIQPRPIVAGLRYRLMVRLMLDFPETFERIYGRDVVGAAQWKTPLLKHGAGVRRIGDHAVSLAPQGGLAAALAHFKLYPDLDAKIDLALSERQYANQSKEYALLDAARRLLSSRRLACEATRRFTGPQSLEQAGLLRPA
jgi:hypothetical protein